MRTAVSSVLLAALAATSQAQELLTVHWNGDLVTVDLATGALTTTSSGFFGLNALALDRDGIYWSTCQQSTNYNLLRIDPATLTATLGPATGDIRGLAATGSTALWAIVNTVPNSTESIDDLVMIDTRSGQSVRIGPTQRSDIQALALHAGGLWGWSLAQGLVSIDFVTGRATDPFPQVNGGFGMQALGSLPDGRLIGHDIRDFFVIDTTTGIAGRVGPRLGIQDVRGVEVMVGSSSVFGQACGATAGPAALTTGGVLAPFGQLVTTSRNHATGRPGLLVLGLDNTAWGSNALPLSLDGALGTAGCNLFVRPDAILLSMTSVNAPATLQFGLTLPPSSAGLQMFVQHACFENVPGGMSWSDAATIRIR